MKAPVGAESAPVVVPDGVVAHRHAELPSTEAISELESLIIVSPHILSFSLPFPLDHSLDQSAEQRANDVHC